MKAKLSKSDRVGLLRVSLDAHTLGLTSVAQILDDCGVACVIAPAAVCDLLDRPESVECARGIAEWIAANKLTAIGFSYRLDPESGARAMGRLATCLRRARLLKSQAGPVRALYFAGLPPACELVRRNVREVDNAFDGGETSSETLAMLGLDPADVSASIAAGARYDEDRLSFGRDLVRKGEYLSVHPPDRTGCSELGTRADTLVGRVVHARRNGLPPIMRAHAARSSKTGPRPYAPSWTGPANWQPQATWMCCP